MKLSRLLDLHPGEGPRVLRMFALLALVIAVSYVLKPVRSALFLSELGSERLPYVYILIAVVLSFLAAAFSRVAPRSDLPSLLSGLSYFFALNLVLFWIALLFGGPFIGFPFYVWVSVETALMPSLFWLLAHHIFYANEGRRLFPVVMAGGLLGSIVGGALASLLVPALGTAGLLLLAAALLVTIGVLTRLVAMRERRRMSGRRFDLNRQERSREISEEAHPMRLVARSRYLSSIAALVLITTLTSTVVDYQFNSMVEEAFATRDALTRFFGAFFAVMNVVAFLLQILVAGRFLSRVGVVGGLLLLPLALFLASFSFLLVPSLLTASVLKTADDGLNNSLNRASLEVLYLPVSLSLKNRIKSWIDMFVERVSRGLGGLTILALTSVLSFSERELSFAVLLFLVPWALRVLSLRKEYVETLRESIARRDITDFDSTLRDPASREVFHQVLSGADPREIAYALDLLRGTRDPMLLEEVARLASHPSPQVRAPALRVLRDSRSPIALDEFERRVRDEDVLAGAEALVLWLRMDPEKGRQEFECLVREGDLERVAAVLDSIENEDEFLPQPVLEDLARRSRESGSERSRRVAAKAMGFLPEAEVSESRLLELLQDPDLEVARAAATSAGRLRFQQVFPALVGALERRPLRAQIRRALSRFGSDAVPQLSEALRDPALPLDVRRALPRTMAEIYDQQSVEALFRCLPNQDPTLHYQAIKSLARLRARSLALRFPRAEVDRLLEHERRGLVELTGLLNAIQRSSSRSGARDLLITVLEERVEFTRERIFRLLGLVYPQKEIAGIWNRIGSGLPSVRGAALEYLSSLLSTRDRLTLFPWIEAGSEPGSRRRRPGLEGEPLPRLEEALGRLARSTDDWLAACAVTVAGQLRLDSLRPLLEPLKVHPAALVREAAARALESFP